MGFPIDFTFIAQYIKPAFLIPVILVMLFFVLRNILQEYKKLKDRL